MRAPFRTRPHRTARALDRAGKPGATIEVLGAFAGREEPDRARVAFEAFLHGTDPVVLAHALETWVAYQAPDSATLERAAAWALQHDFPALAQRVREHHRGPFPKRLDASIARALGGQVSCVRCCRSRRPRNLAEPGYSRAGPFAGDYERAELEATSALSANPVDALYALRAQARFALGMRAQSLEDVRTIGDREVRREALLGLLALSNTV